MNPVNRVIFSRREYPNKDALYQAVAMQLRLLLESGYMVVANKEDEVGDGIALDYSMVKDSEDWPKPYWLVKNEMLAAADAHIDNEVSNAKQVIATAEHANSIVDTLFKGIKKDGGNNGNDGGGFNA